LEHVALFVEQVGESIEHPGTHDGIALEDLEDCFQVGLCLAKAAQMAQRNGAVHPSDGNVLGRTPQRSLHLQDSVEAAQGGFPILLGKVAVLGNVKRANERAGEVLGVGRLQYFLARAVSLPPGLHLC
jgi:hypothetical protein